MNRFAGVALLLAGLIAFGPAAGDEPKDAPKPPETEPPIRLRKKPNPDKKAPPAEPAKKEVEDPPKKEEQPEDPEPAPAEDEKEILARIAKNMRSSESRLKTQDPGEETRQVQRDIIKDLNKLIEQSRQQQQQQKNSQASRKNSKSKRGTGQKGERQPSPNQKTQKGKGKNGGQAKSGQEPKNGSSSQSTQGGQGASSPAGPPEIGVVYKEVWGHMPEKLREEMEVYAREEFMLRYQDLLKQYYARIAEKGRRNKERDR